jgi:hypothetical protein
MTTIKFPEIPPKKIHVHSRYERGGIIPVSCLNGKKVIDPDQDRVIKSSSYQGLCREPCYNNGFLGTIYHAYSEHIPLSLRPDDCWIAILVNLGRYVQNHAEGVRHFFVDHQGQKDLVVKVDSPYLEHTTEEHWEGFVEKMITEVKSRTKDGIVSWMSPDFTTTTNKDRMVANLAIMSTVRKYFTFGFELSCGLSQVTLEGTTADWEKLYEKASKLSELHVDQLDQWVSVLLPVLKEFVNTCQGQVNEDFWQRICTSQRRGSGSQQSLRGWFLVFSAFDEDGKYLLNPSQVIRETGVYGSIDDDEIPDCSVSVNATVDDHGHQYRVVFFGGVLLTRFDGQKNSVSPQVGWIMIEKKHIDLEIMSQYLASCDYKPLDQRESINKTRQLLEMVYPIAEKAHVPNEMLMDLACRIRRYYFNYTHNTHPAVDINHGLLTFICKQKQYREPNPFAEYFQLKSVCAGQNVTCDYGHQLVDTSHAQLCAENEGYRTGYQCDVCGHSPIIGISHHCTQCGFDVCSNCFS